jgi:hypothetical protein
MMCPDLVNQNLHLPSGANGLPPYWPHLEMNITTVPLKTSGKCGSTVYFLSKPPSSLMGPVEGNKVFRYTSNPIKIL